MSNGLLHTLILLETMSKQSGVPLEKVAVILRLEKEEDARLNATRRSSPDEIEAIETGLDALFEKNPETEMTTKELAREIHVSPTKQGNLTRISRKAKMLRLAYHESKKAA